MKNKKEYYNEIEIMMLYDKVVEAAKLPRTTTVAVIKDANTGFLNAGAYSLGVISVEPLTFIFGVKSNESRHAYTEVDNCVVSFPSKSQVDKMYITALQAPHGISEIDIAGLTELPSHLIDCPGIKEFPINCECRIRKVISLKGQLRNIIIADVVGISMDASLLDMPRCDVIQSVPIHEAIQSHPKSKRFGLSTLDGKIKGDWESSPSYKQLPIEGGKVFLSKEHFNDPETQNIFINAVPPRPNYILTTNNADGSLFSEAITGGLIMHTKPAVQIPLRKDSISLENIKRDGLYSIAVVTTELIGKFLALREKPGVAENVGFTYIPGSYEGSSAIEECPTNFECKIHAIEELPDSPLVVTIGEKCGLIIDENLVPDGNYMELYKRYAYSLFDFNMVEQFGQHDPECMTIKGLPTWGSRYYGGWWGSADFYQSGFVYWLLDLIQANYISEQEYALISRWISWFRTEGSYSPEPLRSITRNHITRCLNIMSNAHRDEDAWNELHEYLAPFLKGQSIIEYIEELLIK